MRGSPFKACPKGVLMARVVREFQAHHLWVLLGETADQRPSAVAAAVVHIDNASLQICVLFRYALHHFEQAPRSFGEHGFLVIARHNYGVIHILLFIFALKCINKNIRYEITHKFWDLRNKTRLLLRSK